MTERRIDITGEVLWQGDDGYEEARRGAVWNARKPSRYPEVIVLAESDEDVAGAVSFARKGGLKVAISSGGHNMLGAGLRDGGMLIDLSRLRELSIDPASTTAVVGPAITGRDFSIALAEHGLAFPVGHCGSVALGGYLLSGGFGWNMGSWGPACFHIRSMEIVTAEGELVEADAEQNPDLFWAARGGGSGFFGVVIRFHLNVFPLPRAIKNSIHLYPLSEVEELSRWAQEIAPTLPPTVEMFLFLGSAPPDTPAGPAGKAVGMAAAAFAETGDEATSSLSFLESFPGAGRAIMRTPPQDASFQSLQDLIGTFLPEGLRFAEDAIWSSESLPVLLPSLAEHVVRAPSERSHVLSPVMRPPPEGAVMPDAAFSMVGRSLLLCYAVWEDESDDDRNERWLREMAASVGRFTIGHYIGENDLLAGPARAKKSYAPENWAKLQTLKRKYDPTNLFHTYLESVS